MKRVLHFLIAYAAALGLLITPAFGQVAVDTTKTGTTKAATLLDASAVAVILPSSGSSNASGQITMTTALPATPTGTVGLFLPSGVVTAGTQGTGAAVYQATCSSTTVCTLTGTVTTANAAYTQVITEVVLATTTVPGGSMGLNGAIEPRSVWSYPNNANNKSLRVKLGATSFLSTAQTTTVNLSDVRRIRNRNSASVQVGSMNNGSVSFGVSTTAPTPGAIDTSVDQSLTYTGQLAVATDYIILESRETWLLP